MQQSSTPIEQEKSNSPAIEHEKDGSEPIEEEKQESTPELSEIAQLPREFVAKLASMEEKYKGRILALQQNLELTKRKVKNLKFVAEASEALAAEAHLCKTEAVSRAVRSDALLHRLAEVNEREKREKAISQLEERILKEKKECAVCEEKIRDCVSDPLLHLPAGTSKRRLLARTENKIQALLASIKSESEFLQHLQDIEVCYHRHEPIQTPTLTPTPTQLSPPIHHHQHPRRHTWI